MAPLAHDSENHHTTLPAALDAPRPWPRLVGVLDMGASAIRLVIAEMALDGTIRIIEEASRGTPLGRDSFSSGAITPQTVDATLAALNAFRQIMHNYGVQEVRAVATSAVREARNRDLFLDRILGETGFAFETINEAEENRLVFLAVREATRTGTAFNAEWTLVVEVGGGSTSLMLLRRGRPNRSGVYALGAVRLRQQLDLRRQKHDVQVALLKRSIAIVIEEIRVEIPLDRITHAIAIGGDVRFAASQIVEGDPDAGVREIPREAFTAFCDDVERMDEDQLADRFRLPAVEADTLVPALLIYRTLLSGTAATHLVVADASLRAGVLLDLAAREGPEAAQEFEGQVLASAEALGHKYRFDWVHGRHVAVLATRLFDEFRGEHRLSSRERLLLQVAALLHDVGIYVSLRAHHKHTLYLLASSQIYGLSDEETTMVANIARYHRRVTPQDTHTSYIALDRRERLVVNKLAALLRVANALDAEHLQKVKDLRLVQHDQAWVVELHGTGDLTMEQLAASARADMFLETFGRPLHIRQVEGWP
jgi:exopolyphosphatase/guanosine-5'-triphosphate,3'-diphosphate pyrophosphatase